MAFDYNYNYFNYLYLEHWHARRLRFCDAFAGVAYSAGIKFDILENSFPDLMYAEPNSTSAISSELTIDDQIIFLNNNLIRTPKKVLEIGGGRGEIACTFTKMNIDVTSIDIAEGVDRWFLQTGNHFFGNTFVGPTPIQAHINDVDIDFSQYDTILMSESLEHIREEEFLPVWHDIVNNFHGLFIVVNHMGIHPIQLGTSEYVSEEEHCRIVDDALYDSMSKQAKSVIFRKLSHLVLEF